MSLIEAGTPKQAKPWHGGHARPRVKLSAGIARSAGRVAVLTAAFAVLNLPFWLLQLDVFLSRPWLNVELLLPLVLAGWSLPASVLALVLLWSLDLAASNSMTFYFSSPLEFLRSAPFLTSTHLSGFVSSERWAEALAFAVCAGVALIGCRWRLGRHLPWRQACLIGLLVAAVDVVNGSSMLSVRAVRLTDANPCGSPTMTLLARALGATSAPLRALPPEASTRASIDVEAWAARHPDQGALFVVVESMGVHRDTAMRRWLLDRLAPPALRDRFTVVESRVPFHGPTTAGELRELCGMAGSYRRLKADRAAQCLPSQLASLGWQTKGFHGFSGQMFARSTWWPELGFAEMHFAEDMLQSGQATCGAAFAGACDADVIANAMQEVRHGRTMSYVLTLNSHLPLREAPIPADLAAVCKAAATGHDVCLLTATLGVALSAIAVELDRPSKIKPLVVVVGDHAPPFAKLESRSQYNQLDVAAFVLTPK